MPLRLSCPENENESIRKRTSQEFAKFSCHDNKRQDIADASIAVHCQDNSHQLTEDNLGDKEREMGIAEIKRSKDCGRKSYKDIASHSQHSEASPYTNYSAFVCLGQQTSLKGLFRQYSDVTAEVSSISISSCFSSNGSVSHNLKLNSAGNNDPYAMNVEQSPSIVSCLMSCASKNNYNFGAQNTINEAEFAQKIACCDRLTRGVIESFYNKSEITELESNAKSDFLQDFLPKISIKENGQSNIELIHLQPSNCMPCIKNPYKNVSKLSDQLGPNNSLTSNVTSMQQVLNTPTSPEQIVQCKSNQMSRILKVDEGSCGENNLLNISCDTIDSANWLRQSISDRNIGRTRDEPMSFVHPLTSVTVENELGTFGNMHEQLTSFGCAMDRDCRLRASKYENCSGCQILRNNISCQDNKRWANIYLGFCVHKDNFENVGHCLSKKKKMYYLNDIHSHVYFVE